METNHSHLENFEKLERSASRAVAEAIQDTLSRNIPIVYAKDGVIYREHPNKVIEVLSHDDPNISSCLPVLGYDHYHNTTDKLPTHSGLNILRIFAGPNGSGKSTIFNYIAERYESGIFVNPDEIEKRINDLGEFDLKQFDITSPLEIVKDCIHNSSWKKVSIGKACIENMGVNRDLVIKPSYETHSYSAAIIADIVRDLLLIEGKHFSFETVMSHPSKIDFMQKAIDSGYKCYLYYICTESPLINQQRVMARVKKGGHYVPAELIEKRYYDSLSLLYPAIQKSFRAFLVDNSQKRDNISDGSLNNMLCIEFQEGLVKHRFVNDLPEWVKCSVILHNK